jgi:hypothetical protein
MKATPSYRLTLALPIIVLLIFLVGCATREKLALADVPEQIELTSQVSYKAKALNGMKWEYIALPGTYVAERKDSDGVYFYGSGRSIVEIGELYGNVPRLKVGGIYVPNDKSQFVQFVWAFENTVTTTNDLDQYVQQRTVTAAAMPALNPGVSAGASIVGNVVGGAVIAGILQAGEGEITRLTVKDQASSDLLRSSRRVTASRVNASTPAPQK